MEKNKQIRFKNEFKSNRGVIILNPVFIYIAVTFLLLLTVFIFIPFLSTLFNSFFQNNTVSINGYKQLFFNRKFQISLLNSIMISGITALVSVAIGFLFAFSIHYYRLCNNNLFKIIPVISLFSPHGMFSLAFILLFGKTGVFSSFTGEHFTAANHYLILIITQGISLFPLSYFMLAIVFNQFPIHAAGIKNNYVLKAIYCFPYLLLCWIITFNCAFIDWQHPIVLKSRYNLVSLINYEQSQVFSNTTIQSTMCIFLITITLIFSSIAILLLKSRHHPSHINKISHVKQISSSGSVFFFSLCILVSLYVGTSIIVIIAGSIQKCWGISWDISFQHYLFSVRKIIGIGSDVFLQAGITIQIILALFIIMRYFSKDTGKTIRGKLPEKTVHYFFFILPGTIISCGYLFGFGSNNVHFPESVFYICLGYIFYTLISKLKYPHLVLKNQPVNQPTGSKEKCVLHNKSILLNGFLNKIRRGNRNNSYFLVVFICLLVFWKYNVVSLLFQRSLMNSDVSSASAIVVVLYICMVCVVLIVAGMRSLINSYSSLCSIANSQ